MYELKLLEDNTGVNIHGLELGNSFLDVTAKAQGKNNWILPKLKTFLP